MKKRGAGKDIAPIEKKDLTDIASKLMQGEIGALFDLRKKIVNVELLECYNQTEASTFLVLYISKKLLNDIWRNLGTDNEFDFPEKELGRFCKQFGFFMKEVLREGNQGQTWDVLANCVGAYYSVLANLDKEL